MGKALPFGNSDSDSENDEFRIDNDYAKKYNRWRKEEELNKLKTKYRDESDEDSSSSSEEDDNAVELTEDVEREFFRTLSCLKSNDPRIYDKDTVFFTDKSDSQTDKKKKEKSKPLTIKDYEINLILDQKEVGSESESELDTRARSPTYAEEQQQAKESFKAVLDDADDESDPFLQPRQKTKEEREKEEVDYKEWLSGQKDSLEDKDLETDLKALKDYWNDPNLDVGEKYLRDYILNKRYLENENDDYIPTQDEIIHDSDEGLSEDEKTIAKQEEFEYKYNFRYEDPDPDFIKSYPRTIEDSLRKKDTKRKQKRIELKERKQKEKEQRMEERKRLQELKKMEIEEKISKLKEITGATDVDFNVDDLEADFDPESHDKRMQELFNEDFYEGPEGEQKPEFPELDEELEIENWKKWDGKCNESEEDDAAKEPHCEDENFNMDCDYDPERAQKQADTKGKKKKKRKSKVAEAVSRPKPVFDPNEKTFEEYWDEYYKLDCEDFIGDLPCRFKYRKVPPNSFGLTIEEILMADDRELNRWCSLKKAVQYRNEDVEAYDQIAYSKKASNLALKRKILPSLFKNEAEENNGNVDRDVASSPKMGNKDVKEKDETKPGKLKNKSKQKDISTTEENNSQCEMEQKPNKQSEDKKSVVDDHREDEEKVSATTSNDSSNQKKKKKKRKHKKKGQNQETSSVEKDKSDTHNNTNNEQQSSTVNKKRKRKSEKSVSADSTGNADSTENNRDHTHNNTNDEQQSSTVNKRKRKSEKSISSEGSDGKKFKKQNKFSKPERSEIIETDSRLKSFHCNPKKFKNKLKYGNQFQKQNK